MDQFVTRVSCAKPHSIYIYFNSNANKINVYFNIYGLLFGMWLKVTQPYRTTVTKQKTKTIIIKC